LGFGIENGLTERVANGGNLEPQTKVQDVDVLTHGKTRLSVHDLGLAFGFNPPFRGLAVGAELANEIAGLVAIGFCRPEFAVIDDLNGGFRAQDSTQSFQGLFLGHFAVPFGLVISERSWKRRRKS